MAVVARCTDCPWPHPVAYREADGPTTCCPFCGSRSYETDGSLDLEVVDQYNRLHRQLLEADGVGQATATELARRLVAHPDPRRLRRTELKEVPGVGRKNVRSIEEVLAR